jgi:hypothetical protein
MIKLGILLQVNLEDSIERVRPIITSVYCPQELNKKLIQTTFSTSLSSKSPLFTIQVSTTNPAEQTL